MSDRVSIPLRPFSDLFNVAASRPAQMTTNGSVHTAPRPWRQSRHWAKPGSRRHAGGARAWGVMAEELTVGILPAQIIEQMVEAGAIASGQAARSRPDPAGEPRSQARRHRLSRARQLPARPAGAGRRPARQGDAARVQPGRRRRAGDRLRLHRAADGAPQAAARCQRRRQSEILHRPARHLHPHHHRPCARVRHDSAPAMPGRSISRSARAPSRSWCAPARACRRSASAPAMRASTTRRCWRSTARTTLVDSTPHVDNGLTLSIDLGGNIEGDRRLSRQAPHRRHRRRQARPVRRARFLGADPAPLVVGADPRSRPVLHPGVARGGPRAAGLCRRDGALRSAGRRVPRPLCRLLRSGLRPQGGRRRRQPRRAGGAGATRCPSSSSTARPSAGWSTSR